MRSDDIALDISGKQQLPGDRDIGFRQGVILAWDDLTGENQVDIEGEVFSDLDVLISGIGVRYSVNDVVSVQRRQTRYCIQGKIGSVNGAAGSSIQEQVKGSASDNVGSTSGAWVDVPSGALNLNAYVGSSRTCLVLWRTDITVNNSTGEVGWQVSGASEINPGAFSATSIMAQMSSAASIFVKKTVSGFYTLGPGAGLNMGLNTFTVKYKVTLGVGGTGATFGSPQITVIPL